MKPEIKVYFWPKKKFSKQELSFFLSQLTAFERIQAQKIQNIKRYEEFVCGRFLIRNIIGRSEKILKKTGGKPYLRFGPKFNLSHTGAYIALAVSRSTSELGLDIQLESVRKNYEQILMRYSTPEEINIFLSLPLRHQKKYFYKMWSIKEAFAKAKGHGLTERLKKPMPYKKIQFYYSKIKNIHLAVCDLDRVIKPVIIHHIRFILANGNGKFKKTLTDNVQRLLSE